MLGHDKKWNKNLDFEVISKSMKYYNSHYRDYTLNSKIKEDKTVMKNATVTANEKKQT